MSQGDGSIALTRGPGDKVTPGNGRARDTEDQGCAHDPKPRFTVLAPRGCTPGIGVPVHGAEQGSRLLGGGGVFPHSGKGGGGAERNRGNLGTSARIPVLREMDRSIYRVREHTLKSGALQKP